jgi:hypothetical protein
MNYFLLRKTPGTYCFQRVPRGDLHCILRFGILGRERMIQHLDEYGHERTGLYEVSTIITGSSIIYHAADHSKIVSYFIFHMTYGI